MLRRASQGHVQKDALVAGRLVVDAVVGHLLSAQRAVVDVPGEDVAQVLVAGADGEQELQKEDRPEAHAGEKRRGHERGALVQQQHLRRVQVEAGGAVGDVHLRGDERDVRWGGPSGEPGITRITHPVVHLVDVPVRQAEVQEAVAPVVVHVHDLEGGGGGARRAESVTVLRGKAEHERLCDALSSAGSICIATAFHSAVLLKPPGTAGARPLLAQYRAYCRPASVAWQHSV